MSTHTMRSGVPYYVGRILIVTVLVLSAGFVVSACMTPSEKRDMHNDIFNLQTRLLTLERENSQVSADAKSTGDQAKKGMASTRTEIDKVMRDIQQMRGEIDALRVGVTTGQMPGVDAEQEGTLAYTLAQINERLNAVETAQDEILDAISKAGVKKNTKSPITKKSNKAAGLKELQAAFDKRRYKQVSQEASGLIATVPTKDREQVRFLLAESLFKLGSMREAALRFNEYIEAGAARARAPLAKMRLGDCFRNMGDHDTARIYYEELIKEFPDSSEAAKAKERLAEESGKKSRG